MTAVATAINWVSPEDYLLEVISPQTERTDRVEKMLAYPDIPEIRSYVILEQDQVQAAVMSPAASGWKTETIRGLGATLALSAFKIEIPLARIYERTALAGRKTN